MRIARIGGLTYPIPAPEYGGTQRSMAQMTAFQAALCAHDITIYAPQDSTIISFTQDVGNKLGLATQVDTNGDSIAIRNPDGRIGRVTFKSGGIHSTGLTDPDESAKNKELFQVLLRDEREQPFDLIHCHARRLMASSIIPNGLAPKTLVHQHNAGLEKTYERHPYPLICISENQADHMRKDYNAQVFDVIYHGLDSSAYRATTEHAGYLAWIGRFLVEKGADRAIRIAKAADKPLILAGMVYEQKTDSVRHFNEDVKPYIDVHDPEFLNRIQGMQPSAIRQEIAAIEKKTGIKNPAIFCGSANEDQKQTLYGNAQATLFPISWAEPFGRVMIESMACGTPVIGNRQLGAIDCGSVAEVIDQGITGFSIASRNEGDALQRAVEAVALTSTMDRKAVRTHFDQRWTSEINAHRLDAAYRRFLSLPEEPANKRELSHSQVPNASFS